MSDSTAAAHLPVAQFDHVTKVFGQGQGAVTALDDVTLAIWPGEFTAVMGPSGSGKSTLMHVMAGLDTPTSGRVWLGEDEITRLGDEALTRIRREHVGFVFQAFNLMPTMNVLENVRLPLELGGARASAEDEEWIRDPVGRLGLADRVSHRPGELSGGQQQRVAIARALTTRPTLVFADEPTGNLDRRSSAEVLDLLAAAVTDLGQSIVMVTHDPGAASRASRVVFLADGAVVEDLAGPLSRTEISTIMDGLEDAA